MLPLLMGRTTREKMVKREKPDLRDEHEIGQRPFCGAIYSTSHHIFVLNKNDFANNLFSHKFHIFKIF